MFKGKKVNSLYVCLKVKLLWRKQVDKIKHPCGMLVWHTGTCELFKIKHISGNNIVNRLPRETFIKTLFLKDAKMVKLIVFHLKNLK